MTKEKSFKRKVRDVAKRTGQSYAATRARLDKRRETVPTLDDAASPYTLLRMLAAVVERAAEELEAAERANGAWSFYRQRPGVPDTHLPPNARELRTRLEALDDRDVFTVLVIIIWGKLQYMLSFEEAVADARRCVDEDGIDFGIDYAFRKLPATKDYFRDGLMLLEGARWTPESCWKVGFGDSVGTGESKRLRRRVEGRPWAAAPTAP
jgi:hypothetical protein